MKRKFSFNLAPVKIASKNDDKSTPEPTPSQPPKSASHTHRRHNSEDSICDYSPFINRRVLDIQTEQELRAACKLILQNFKPSDHGMEDTDPKLDFGGLQRPRQHRAKDRNDQRTDVKVRMPTGAPVDLKTALEARGLKQTELTLKSAKDAPARANSSRKRSDSSSKPKPDFGWLDDRDEKREANLRKSSSIRRRSRQFDPATADAEATEWMQRERDNYDPSDPQARPSTAVRPPSRARSIRNNIEKLFPGTNSRSLSRAQSIESLRTANSNASGEQDGTRSGSAAGWRTWSLRRNGSSRSNSRPGTSRGLQDEPEEPKAADKSVINLNRELPPLPSLDSWKDADQPQAEMPKSPMSPTHIASVMRPQDPLQAASMAAKRKSHRRSGSDTLAMQYNASLAARSPLHAVRQTDAVSRTKALTPDSLHALEGMTIAGSASTSNLSHMHQRSVGSSVTPKMSSEVVNFSHKMSLDIPSRPVPTQVVYPTKKDEQKSRLKKVFTGWMSRKEKKNDWMHKIEKQGIKEGVMIKEGAAGAPVVRY